jgi:hypothetical protein
MRNPLNRSLSLLVSTVAAAGVAAAGGAQAKASCNGRPELCDRAYNAVTYPSTHDSYTTLKYISLLHRLIPFHDLVTYIGFVDQDGTITEQLDAGIRAFDLRLINDENKVPQLCHASHDECQSEKKFLKGIEAVLKKDWKHPSEARPDLEKVFYNASMAFSSPDAVYEEFHHWMDKHPNEVVTIFNGLGTGVSVDFVDGLLTRHQLKKYLHHHDAGKPWAKLGEMIKGGKRLVVFAGNGKGDILDSGPYMKSWSKGWNGNWKTSDIIDDCGPFASPAELAGAEVITEINHKLTMSIARLRDPHFNTKALQTHLFNCFTKYKKAPTYLHVDFYKDSWVVKLAGDANGNSIRKP